ncbi:MAG TPA: 50S ribosomal protein L15 [Candidatus Saccharimonadales bacterium]|nr:50S ribosomal protein L15 [Candidatus Saccharimonadales bacterium]
MLQLNNLLKLTEKRKRVGRGGSRGGTSGKGHKGQKARSGGGVSARFEGGQMPLSRRLPKRGFSNHMFKQEFDLVTLEQLERLFQDGQTVTKQMLQETGCVKKGKLVKVLATGVLQKNITLEVDACSKSAKDAVERVGGAVKLV